MLKALILITSLTTVAHADVASIESYEKKIRALSEQQYELIEALPSTESQFLSIRKQIEGLYDELNLLRLAEYKKTLSIYGGSHEKPWEADKDFFPENYEGHTEMEVVLPAATHIRKVVTRVSNLGVKVLPDLLEREDFFISYVSEPTPLIPGPKMLFPAYYKPRRLSLEVSESLKAEYSQTHDFQRAHYELHIRITEYNIEALIDYFANDGKKDELRARIETALKDPLISGMVEVKEFLPKVPRRLLRKYPTAEENTNCHGTTFSFHRDQLVHAFPTPPGVAKPKSEPYWEKDFMLAMVDSNYCRLEAASVDSITWQFGDILYNSSRDHSARVLFKGHDGKLWVFNKAGGGRSDAWKILPYEEAFFPRKDQGRGFEMVQVFRRCK